MQGDTASAASTTGLIEGPTIAISDRQYRIQLQEIGQAMKKTGMPSLTEEGAPDFTSGEPGSGLLDFNALD